MKKVKKILNVIVDILIVIVLIVSGLILAMTLTSKDTGSPHAFGYTINAIQSGSMEPVFYKGDMLIGKATDEDQTYEKGDIVMFQSSYTGDDGQEYILIKCHRIIEVKQNDGKNIYLTKGDNNSDSDEKEDGYISSDMIVGIYDGEGYHGTLLSGWGNIMDFMQSKTGFFLVIVLPMIIFFIYETIRVIMNITAYSKQKALESIAKDGLTEEQRKKAIEEYLEQQKSSDEKVNPEVKEE